MDLADPGRGSCRRPGGLLRYSTEPFPPYRFVPGEHPHPRRDPAGHSYGRAEVVAPLSADSWQHCEPYLYGIDLFNHRFWWEAHEALEPLWLAAGRQSRDGLFLQGLIQVAAALLRYSMGPTVAARAKAEEGIDKLRRVPNRFLGVDVPTLIDDVRVFLDTPNADAPVIRLVMPVDDAGSRG